LKTTILRIPEAWSYVILATFLLLSSAVDASGREFANLREVLQAHKGKIITSDMLDPAVKEEIAIQRNPLGC
jgi:hypothetical protein